MRRACRPARRQGCRRRPARMRSCSSHAAAWRYPELARPDCLIMGSVGWAISPPSGRGDNVVQMSRNPTLTCDPSQNGLLREWPQRQNAVFGPHAVRVAPSLLTSVNHPSMRHGPFVVGMTRNGLVAVAPAAATTQCDRAILLARWYRFVDGNSSEREGVINGVHGSEECNE